LLRLACRPGSHTLQRTTARRKQNQKPHTISRKMVGFAPHSRRVSLPDKAFIPQQKAGSLLSPGRTWQSPSRPAQVPRFSLRPVAPAPPREADRDRSIDHCFLSRRGAHTTTVTHWHSKPVDCIHARSKAPVLRPWRTPVDRAEPACYNGTNANHMAGAQGLLQPVCLLPVHSFPLERLASDRHIGFTRSRAPSSERRKGDHGNDAASS